MDTTCKKVRELIRLLAVMAVCQKPEARGQKPEAAVPSDVSVIILRHKFYYIRTALTLLMSITIHYKGKIKDISLRDTMTEELADICESLNWKHNTIRRGTETCLAYQYPDEPNSQGEKVDVKFSGIVFTPPGAESVVMLISNGGWVVHPLSLSHFGKDPSNEFKEFAYSQFVKTQFAGPEIHIALIKLFKYLSAKYFDFFEVRDEADYWETMDKEILLGKFKFMNNLHNKVESWLNSEIFSDANNLEDIVDKIEKLLRQRKRKLDEDNKDKG